MRPLLTAALALTVLAGCRFEARADAPVPEPAETVGATAPAAAAATPAVDGVTVYITEWCPYCQKTQEYLDEIEVPYTAVDIEASPEAYAEYQEQGGQGGIPLVVIGDRRIEGYSIEAFDQALAAADL